MFAVRVVGWALYTPQAPSARDLYASSDVTIIVPTIDADEDAMREAIRSWVLNEPKEIIIVTVQESASFYTGSTGPGYQSFYERS